ncbi:hypothetical protein [Ureibacillus chungkukjangi]|uniref:Uncharacterized protein n=1 Tax=Ureibacillus chungkukjangi TaxID=1202712 RepID=A0A318U0Z8_9BACL|nr:hypothetical protein [Ureibacillus chungkukjangi]MCM3387748.1 hypothetical protein [Ureibacillus chungkukjangi]PYF08065.1 hypothetical protein BJ095_103236 [Ureibacillus chungkukjangi]HCG4536289.1 hypothetical protein [Salmonella enterica subsp. enterica serovar Typhi str. AG3]
MVRKLLVTVVLVVIVTLFVYPQRDSIISVFRITDEPLIISKGNYGQSLIVEISFSHDGLEEWLQTLKQPYPLLMLDADWIARSPKIVAQIKKQNIPTGLLGGKGAKNNYSLDDFNKDLQIYEKHFNNKPLWFMTSDYEFETNLQQTVFNQEINLLSPSMIYSKETYKKSDGGIYSLKLHENSKPNFEEYSKLIESEKFVSIEENVFGYTIKTKKIPK